MGNGLRARRMPFITYEEDEPSVRQSEVLKEIYTVIGEGENIYTVFRNTFPGQKKKDILLRLEQEVDGTTSLAEFEFVGAYNRCDYDVVEGGWPDRPVWKYKRLSDDKILQGLSEDVRDNVRFGDSLHVKPIKSERALSGGEIGVPVTLSGLVIGIRKVSG